MFKIQLLDEIEPLAQRGQIGSDLMIPLQISIGEIEIPLSSILKLNQSETIALSLGETSLVTLLLGGEPLATAEMILTGEVVELKINKVFLDQVEQKNDNEEVGLEEI